MLQPYIESATALSDGHSSKEQSECFGADV